MYIYFSLLSLTLISRFFHVILVEITLHDNISICFNWLLYLKDFKTILQKTNEEEGRMHILDIKWDRANNSNTFSLKKR